MGVGGRSSPLPGRFNLEKDTRYPLYRMLGGTQVQSGMYNMADPRIAQPVASRYTDTLSRPTVIYSVIYF